MKSLKVVALALLAGTVVTASAQGPRGGPMGQDIPVLKQFDRNDDGWLNAAERKDARLFIQSQGMAMRRGGRGRGFFAGGGAKGVSVTPAEVKTYPNAPFYDESVLRTLFFTFEENDWENELDEFHGTDVDVAATLVVDGKTYRDVGVHFRGMSSYMGVPEGLKRSLNVAIDMAHSNQDLGGYRTLNLLNSHEDPTFMRAVLFLHIARQYLPAAKANLVRVVINGEDWGIYSSIQQFNKEFLKDNFKDTGGARWKAPGPNPQTGLQYLGENLAVYQSMYEIKSKDDPAQWQALQNLTKVLAQTPTDQLPNVLPAIMDVDQVLKFLALDVALVNNDGYWTRGSDYNIYRDAAGRFHILPHDTNETFGIGGAPGMIMVNPTAVIFNSIANALGLNGPNPIPPTGPRGGPMGFGGPQIDPLIAMDQSKPLRAKLLAVPAYREKYLGYVREIATKWLDWNTIGPLVEQYKTLIDANVKLDNKKLESYEAFLEGTTGSMNSLKSFAETRRQFLLR